MKTVIVGARACVPAGVSSLVRRVLRDAARELDVGPGELTVRFVSADEMRGLNARWRAKDYATDVLSFPADALVIDGVTRLGDLAICFEVATRQAPRRRHSAARETALLALHGMLHLLGYDHETDAGEMDALERSLRRRVLPPKDAC